MTKGTQSKGLHRRTRVHLDAGQLPIGNIAEWQHAAAIRFARRNKIVVYTPDIMMHTTASPDTRASPVQQVSDVSGKRHNKTMTPHTYRARLRRKPRWHYHSPSQNDPTINASPASQLCHEIQRKFGQESTLGFILTFAQVFGEVSHVKRVGVTRRTCGEARYFFSIYRKNATPKRRRTQRQKEGKRKKQDRKEKQPLRRWKQTRKLNQPLSRSC